MTHIETESEESQSEFAIVVENLTKYYGEIRGVENISFKVRKGEIHGFLGPNGAGKTTTIRILVGLMNETKGSAKILGLDAGSIEAKKLIGYLPSDFGLYEHYTVDEYLNFLAKLRGGAPYKDELVRRLDLDVSRRTSELSKGNRQKVSIVQALMHEPKILIADEPTSGLDPLMQAEFDSYLQEYIKRGNTVFVSSHILAEVQEIADKVTVIRQGEIVDSGKVDELLANVPRKAILKVEDGITPEEIAKKLEAKPGHQLHDKITIYFDYDTPKFVKKLNGLEGIIDFSIPEPSLEEYFLPLYNTQTPLEEE